MLYIDTIFLQMNLPQGPDLIAWTCQQLVTDLSMFPPKHWSIFYKSFVWEIFHLKTIFGFLKDLNGSWAVKVIELEEWFSFENSVQGVSKL